MILILASSFCKTAPHSVKLTNRMRNYQATTTVTFVLILFLFVSTHRKDTIYIIVNLWGFLIFFFLFIDFRKREEEERERERKRERE